MGKVTFGVIVGNRGFFPDILAKEGRKDILEVLKNNGYGAVALPMTETKYGAVETLEDARKCAELFASKAKEIDGIIVTLPNFGDERGIAETIKRSGLDVPILIQAEHDVAGQMKIDRRRDSFCGKISVCNNLRQAGIRLLPDPLAHGQGHLGGVQRGPRPLCGDLPDRAGPQERTLRGHRHAAGGLQHRPLQREDPGVRRHRNRAGGPVRDPGQGRPAGGQRSKGQSQAGRDHRATPTPSRSRPRGS